MFVVCTWTKNMYYNCVLDKLGRFYLIFEWCVDLRMDTKRKWKERDWTTCSKVVNHCKNNNQHHMEIYTIT